MGDNNFRIFSWFPFFTLFASRMVSFQELEIAQVHAPFATEKGLYSKQIWERMGCKRRRELREKQNVRVREERSGERDREKKGKMRRERRFIYYSIIAFQ